MSTSLSRVSAFRFGPSTHPNLAPEQFARAGENLCAESHSTPGEVFSGSSTNRVSSTGSLSLAACAIFCRAERWASARLGCSGVGILISYLNICSALALRGAIGTKLPRRRSLSTAQLGGASAQLLRSCSSHKEEIPCEQRSSA
jgi:hypothetical protein